MIFVFYEDTLVTYGPTFSYDLVLAAMLSGTNTVQVRRYEYRDIIRIQDIWRSSHKQYVFRIMNHQDHMIWSDKATLGEAVGEFCSRGSPFISYGQRAAYMDKIRPYTRDEIVTCFKKMFMGE